MIRCLLHRQGPTSVTRKAGGAVHLLPHILFISIYYWPDETGISPYSTLLAEHLAKSGWRVTVLTAMPHYPAWQVHWGYRGKIRQREIVRGVDVIRLRTYIPQRQSAVRRAAYEVSFLLHVVSLLPGPRPTVILGTIPSLSGGILAAIAAKRYGIPYGLYVQDLVAPAAGQTGIAGGGKAMRVTQVIEGWVARRAAGIVVIAGRFRPYLEGLGVSSERISYVPNWSHIQGPNCSPADVRSQLGWPQDAQIVLHAGNMGLKQGLEHVLAAARLATTTSPRIHFVLLGDGSQRSALEARARGCPNVTFLDPQPAATFPNVLAAADVLLINERRSVVDMALPSKLTSYYIVGRPIVAAVTPEGTTAREIARSGAGLIVAAEDPTALLHALDQLAADRALADRLAAAGQRYAADYLDEQTALARMEQFIGALVDPTAMGPVSRCGPRDDFMDGTAESPAS